MAKKSFLLKPSKAQMKKAPPPKGEAPFSGRSARPEPPEGVRWAIRKDDPPQKMLTPGHWWWVFKQWGDGHSRSHIGFVEGTEEVAVGRAREAWPQHVGNLDLVDYMVVPKAKAKARPH